MIGVAVAHRMATWEARLWCAVLLTQSLPYLASVTVALLAAVPSRKRVIVSLPLHAAASAAE
jgi:hypothetical protein